MRTYLVKVVPLCVSLALIIGLASCPSAAAEDIRVTPQSIAITTFFQGAPVSFYGRIPKGSAAVLELRGPEHDEHLMRKGRRMRLWMNVGELQIQKAPSVYLCMSTDRDVLSGSDKGTMWGYEALRQHVHLSGELSSGESAEFFKQFVKLKESEGLYGIFPASLSVKEGTEGYSNVEGRLDLPGSMPPGDYEIHLYGVQGKQVASNAAGTLQIAATGFPALLDDLAMQHSLTYGILAVVIAIVAGFAMGYFFTSKGAH
jgi:hypothetical protein